MDEILFPKKKPVKPPRDTGSHELFPPAEPKKATIPEASIVVPADSFKKLCDGKNCGKTVYRVQLPSGNWTRVWCDGPGGERPSPMLEKDGLGINHFIDCVDRDQFRRKKQ